MIFMLYRPNILHLLCENDWFEVLKQKMCHPRCLIVQLNKKQRG